MSKLAAEIKDEIDYLSRLYIKCLNAGNLTAAISVYEARETIKAIKIKEDKQNEELQCIYTY